MQNRRFPTPGSSSRTPKFNVVVAFDDYATSSSAMRTCDYVISQLGDDIQVRRKVVDFNPAADPRKRAGAARDAARADMIIVSTRDQGTLPLNMQQWLDDWSAQRSTEEGALVAILNNKNGTPRTATGGVRDQLAHLAEQMHMDFLSSEVASL